MTLAKKKSRTLVRTAMAMALVCGGCGAAPEEAAGGNVSNSAGRAVTFEEFLSTVHQDADGRYIYDFDMPAYSMEELRQAWERMYPRKGALTAFRYAYWDDVWPSGQQLNLTYCISNDFGSSKQAVINAMNAAGAAWASQVFVNFVYVPAQDANCNSANTNVVFNVNFVFNLNTTTLASAFTPNTSRQYRTLTIYPMAFHSGSGWPLSGLLMHELGHALGFRHEFIQSGTCADSGEWRAITPYDTGSIMMYPQCGGTNTSVLSQSDVEGAAQQYGSRVWNNAIAPAGVCGQLPGGKGLDRGQALWSCDNRFYLQHGKDGNLRLYKVTYTSGGSIHDMLWSSGTANQAGYGAYMQSDGNLVIYTGLGRVLWHTNTYGNPGSILTLQNDGNVVIYSPSGQVLWHTGTWGH